MSNEKFRIEEDTIGEVKIPQEALWGPQTQRSKQNFTTGDLMPLAVIRALLEIKKYAALSNGKHDYISHEKSTLIVASIDSLLKLDDNALRKDFPLHVYQTGSGTQTNMNVNEVVSHQAYLLNPDLEILPNDDVNNGQSSNDTFPTAMNVTAIIAVKKLYQAVDHLISELAIKQDKYWRTVKIGRTHLQDATPLTFGQEISGWVTMLKDDNAFLDEVSHSLYKLPIGGTAVGTGLNASPELAGEVAHKLSDTYKVPFTAKDNKFAGLAAHSGLNITHGAMKTLAADLIKIANDVRFLASGPRAGYSELKIPANEPGSSIMPGKVNPTQAEAITMASAKVLGNDTTIGFAASQGNFEMNVYKPVIIATFLDSAKILTGTVIGFADKMIHGLEVNDNHMKEFVDKSLMTVTALSPHIGYHSSAKIAQLADREGITLREAAIESKEVSAEDFDKWVIPLSMTNIDSKM